MLKFSVKRVTAPLPHRSPMPCSTMKGTEYVIGVKMVIKMKEMVGKGRTIETMRVAEAKKLRVLVDHQDGN